MTRPYSGDLRERAVARFEAGETTRSIAATLRISASCVSKWMKLKRESGSLKPGQIGGHKKPTLRGEPGEWLRERCRSGPFTTRGLAAELLARGIKTDRRAVWVFLRAEGLSFKKNRAAGRADPARHRQEARALEEPSGPD
jgi:putative transposase